ncbi:uncharacterized protein AKAME5_001012000 [Lates japonicus]|uniref:Uncharacterized protein n=1 Tax=Lates japonicus TaxID=270547 RepID=A0AAD3MNB2_LATJO|nr:uncharacterized protein AKAME5_001012000 [Lates japonicus]
MAAEQNEREEEFLESNIFRKNSFIIIEEVLELSDQTEEDTTMLVDEILHSIFFLGEINDPPYSPDDIFDDEEMLNVLRECYPRPFDLYSSQLPKRSPFSCVLDMIVHLIGQENEREITGTLQELIGQLSRGPKAKHLISFAVCVSQNTEISDSVRYYGVSMSTSGRPPGQIIAAASCLSAWDSHVADAVMTYYPDKTKKSYFDGTIRLPDNIRCQAFKLSDATEVPPCRSCGNLFGLRTTESKEWAYGNCAEAESLSNLLKNEIQVKKQIVHLIGQENEREITGTLQELIGQLSRGPKAKHLISFAVCVSQNTEISDSVRYYGVSMSTSGRRPGQIIAAASCLSAWDSHVADAVMTYYPDKTKKSYFDGTIRLPNNIRRYTELQRHCYNGSDW